MSALMIVPVFDSWGLSFSIYSVPVLASGLFVAVIVDSMVLSREGVLSVSETKRKERKQVLAIKPFILIICLAFCAFALLMYYRELMRISGGNIAAYHSMVISATSSEDAGLSTLTNQSVKVLTAFAYISLYILLHNIIASRQKVSSNIVYLLAPLLHCIRIYFSGGRLGWICFFVYAAVVAICLYRSSRGWGRVSWKLLIRVVVVIALFALLFYFTTGFIRVYGTSKTLFEYLTIYFGVPLTSFDLFINDPVTHTSGYFGQETFSRFYNGLGKLGFDVSYVSTALEYRFAGPNANGNVYTFFRRPFSDFGIIGMLIVTAIAVAFLAFLYYRGVYQKRNEGINVWLIFYGYFINIAALASVDNELVQMMQLGNIVVWMLLYLFARYAVDETSIELSEDAPIEKSITLLGIGGNTRRANSRTVLGSQKHIAQRKYWQNCRDNTRNPS